MNKIKEAFEMFTPTGSDLPPEIFDCNPNLTSQEFIILFISLQAKSLHLAKKAAQF